MADTRFNRRDERACTEPVARAGRPFRRDVQALRALAVAAVVTYHLWPGAVRGGFVGVDVFFVISGFLITGQLHEEITRTGRVSLSQFWARRIRRLLPAALLVLAASAVMMVALLPRLAWSQNLGEIRAAAAYGENWLLAAHSVDYLAAENSPSLVQHYWSLSVEEQFYLFWPLLLVGAAWLGTRGRRGAAVPVALLVVGAASLWVSATWTAARPPYAFFATPTRCWEFAAGGIIAVWGARRHDRAARIAGAAAGWAGLAIVVGSAFLVSPRTPYPGLAALVPVGGAALVIAAGTVSGSFAQAPLLAASPVQWLGDTSYSLYLWHWPLIVAAPWLLSRAPGGPAQCVLLALSLTLGAVTRRLVEEPIRRRGRRGGRVPARAAFALASASLVVAVSATSIGYSSLSHADATLAAGADDQGVSVALPSPDGLSSLGSSPRSSPRSSSSRMSAAATGQRASPLPSPGARTPPAVTAPPAPISCVGAAAILPGNGCSNPFGRPANLDTTFAAQDGRSVTCLQPNDATTPQWCAFGTTGAPERTIVVVGNSHARRLIPALDLYGKQRNWRILLAARIDCMGVAANVVGDTDHDTCVAWSAALQRQLLAMPHLDAVVFASHVDAHLYIAGPHAGAAQNATATQAVLDAWTALRAHGVRVLVAGDVPGMRPDEDPACIALSRASTDPCAVPRSSVVKPNLLTDLAQQRADLASYLPLTQYLCDATLCHGLIGGVVVYYDAHHMTSTFSRSLGPYLGRDVERALVAP